MKDDPNFLMLKWGSALAALLLLLAIILNIINSMFNWFFIPILSYLMFNAYLVFSISKASANNADSLHKLKINRKFKINHICGIVVLIFYVYQYFSSKISIHRSNEFIYNELLPLLLSIIISIILFLNISPKKNNHAQKKMMILAVYHTAVIFKTNKAA